MRPPLSMILIAFALVAGAGCGGVSSSDSTSTPVETTAGGPARPVSPNVEPAGDQQASADEFSGCATEAGYTATPGPDVPGGVSVSVANDAGDPVATFIVFPDGTAAAIAAQRDGQSVAGSGGVIRKGLAELVADDEDTLRALKSCL